MQRYLLPLLGMTLLLSSCGAHTAKQGATTPDEPETAPVHSNHDAVTITYAKRAELAAAADARVAQANNAFGLKLLAERMKETPGENAVVSPISVATALSMTMAGARGATQEAISRTLELNGLTPDEVGRGFAKLSELLRQPGPGVQWSEANSLWVRQGWPFRKEYLDNLKMTYDAEVQERNLSDKKVPKEINDSVSRQTHGKIPIVVGDTISEQIKLLLINAIYFNGAWQHPFKPSATQEDDFTNGRGAATRVKMMSQSGMFPYARENGYQVVRLPYGEGQMGMLVVLPEPGTDREALYGRLLADPAAWLKPLKEQSGQLMLPKFRAEGSMNLVDTLKTMGMGIAFDHDKADFSGMADLSAGKLAIGSVLHKTFVDVGEKGTEAAAATVVGVSKASAVAPSERFTMKVDRPFLFAIEDLQSGSLLFVGSIEKL